MRIRFQEALASARHEDDVQMELHDKAMYAAYKRGITLWKCGGAGTEEAIDSEEWQHAALAALDNNDMQLVYALQTRINERRQSRHQVPV